jgi:uncharacterized protein (DUF58 family)
MIVPARRWYLVAAGLALLAPLTLLWPAVAVVWAAANVVWLLALALDAWRIASAPAGGLRIERRPPPAFSVGRRLPVGYRWRNMTDRSLEVRVKEEIPAPLDAAEGRERLIRVAPRGETRESVEVVPRSRGIGTGGTLHLRTLAPFGLAWRQRRVELPWTATVYPSFSGIPLRSLATATQRRREAGRRSVRRLGEGRVFESLREWVPGDDTRTIDWKATARRGKVMARHYEDERRQRVLLVIDAGRMLTAMVDGRPRLEYAVEAALHLAHSAVEHDDDVGIMIFADKVQRYVAPARGRRALRAILDALAAAEGRLVESNYPEAFAVLAARNRKRAFAVLFTDVIDRTASDALLSHASTMRPRHLPLAVTLRDPGLDRLATQRPDTDSAAFDRAAAEELLQSRADALAEMRRRGLLVVDVPPASAASAVVQAYDRLKRQGQI